MGWRRMDIQGVQPPFPNKGFCSLKLSGLKPERGRSPNVGVKVPPSYIP